MFRMKNLYKLVLLSVFHLVTQSQFAQQSRFSTFNSQLQTQQDAFVPSQSEFFSTQPFRFLNNRDNGLEVNIYANPVFERLRELQQVGSTQMRYRTVTNTVGSPAVGNWKTFQFDVNTGMRLHRDTLCTEYEMEVTILSNGRAYLQRLETPEPMLIDRFNKPTSVQLTAVNPFTRADNRVNSLVAGSNQQFTTGLIMLDVAYESRFAFWTPAAGVRIVQSAPQVTVVQCKTLFTGTGLDRRTEPRVLASPRSTVLRPAYTIELSQSLAEHDCLVRVDIRFTLMQTKLTANALTAQSLPSLSCDRDYITSDAEAYKIQLNCASLNLPCATRQSTLSSRLNGRCRMNCHPLEVNGQNWGDVTSSAGRLNVNWRFEPNQFESVTGYILRSAIVNIDSQMVGTGDWDVKTVSLPANTYSHLITPYGRSRRNYTLQICELYSRECSNDDVEWQLQPVYPIQYGVHDYGGWGDASRDDPIVGVRVAEVFRGGQQKPSFSSFFLTLSILFSLWASFRHCL